MATRSLPAPIENLLQSTSEAADEPQLPDRTPSIYYPLHNYVLAKGQQKHWQQQYADMYFCRLAALKPAVEKVASAAWEGFSIGGDTVRRVERVLDVRQGELVWIVGTVYMQMPLKPNILDDISKDHWIAAPAPRSKFVSADADEVMLEDESGRLRLAGDVLSAHLLVTGCIVAVMGTERADGDFEVIDVQVPDLAPQPERWTLAGAASKQRRPNKIAMVSGLGITGDRGDCLPLDLLTEYLLGESGAADTQTSAASISRLLIAGDSLGSSTLVPSQHQQQTSTDADPTTTTAMTVKKTRKYGYDASAYNAGPTDGFDAFLGALLPSLPVTVLPGAADPSHAAMPQQSLHAALFPRARAYMSPPTDANTTDVKSESDTSTPAWLDCVTNPWEGEIDGWRVHASAGQPVDDVFKYVDGDARLDMMEAMLRWRVAAPTAPDTLWCYPFQDADQFVMGECPHLFVVGNQPRFETAVVEGPEGQKVRVVALPRFRDTGELVLVDAETLDVEVVRFSVYEGAEK